MEPGNETIMNHSDPEKTSEYYNRLIYSATTIEKYYIWVIFAVGFPGNLASIVTVLRMKPVTSITCYVALLAVVDNLTLVIKLCHLILQDYDLKVMSETECKFFVFTGNVFLTYASWILVAMAMERFVAVWFPLKLGINWNMKKSFVSMATILLLISAVYLHLLWTMTSYYGSCEISQNYHNYFFLEIWHWISASLYAFIPCTLLFLFNVLIIFGIRKSATEHKTLTSSSLSSITTHRDVTIMLLVVSIVFLILTTPISVYIIVGQSWHPPRFSNEMAEKYMFKQIAYIFCDSNHAINFFLYFLSARRFRHHFHDMHRCASPSSPDTVLLRNRPYRFTTKYTNQGVRMYDDTDTFTSRQFSFSYNHRPK